MKRFRGTKGKWFAVEYAGTYMIQDGEMYEDNNILDSDIYTKEVVDANAQLIATAPELLRVLIGMTLSMKAHPDYQLGKNQELIDYVESAEQVINKALGL